jgi:uncharacterized lipoprotein YddW (UPF0748 family)
MKESQPGGQPISLTLDSASCYIQEPYMSFGGAAVWLRRASAALVVVAAVAMMSSVGILGARAPITGAEPASEVRALWVLRTSLTTPASIHTLVTTAHDHGFNALLVQVRGRGDAYYTSDLEPRAAELVRQPASFDPLARVIEEAHQVGLRVHAWVNLNLVSSAADLPASREHLVYRHPEWLMVPREIAQELRKVDPASPGYVGKVARWTRAQSEKVEGLYSSPLQHDAATHVQAVVTDIATRYAVDGVHLDYARYPSDQFDYSRFAIAEFRAQIRPQVPPAVRRELDEQEAVDLFAYPDRFPVEWKTFRRSQLSALVIRLRTAIKTARPSAFVTVATAPDAQEAYDQRLQDWRGWLEEGVVDAVCPMAYTPEPARFAEQIAAARSIAGGKTIWAGIGAYRLKPEQTIENIYAARRLGAAGFVLFSYDSLTGPKQTPSDYLELVSHAAFGATRANESSSR